MRPQPQLTLTLIPSIDLHYLQRTPCEYHAKH
nr:MAG TPA: hypothetical protein [Caudoviricetes sp.]DAR78513.1 MAG TPA: hypothetical protein [Caudoviricetes sp.]DAV09271.1 MAG TPA: hypothetical protein [Caudoviricetes sp.]